MKFLSSAMLMAAMFSFSPPVFATSSMECNGLNLDAGVSILFGAGPMLSALEADVFLGGRVISTRDRDAAEKAIILQFSADEKELKLELMDDQADQHLASVRILRHLDTDAEPLQVGILSVNNAAPVAIGCDGP